jgi:hypothetical protein
MTASMFKAEEEAMQAACLLHMPFFLEDGVTVMLGK